MSSIQDTQDNHFLGKQEQIVFISYSHDSDDHKKECLKLKIQMLKDGITCIIDQDESFPENGWALWCEKQIESADFVLIICTEEYTKRFNHDEQAKKGNGAKWEGHIIRQTLYDNQINNVKFIPVVLNKADRDHIPRILSGYTNYLITDPAQYKELYGYITNQSKFNYPAKGNLRYLHYLERMIH
jgi:SEFIR domain